MRRDGLLLIPTGTIGAASLTRLAFVQLHIKCRRLVRHAPCGDFAPVLGDNRLGDSEPKAVAAALPRTRGINAVKAVENFIQMLGGYARTCVRHGQLDMILIFTITVHGKAGIHIGKGSTRKVTRIGS